MLGMESILHLPAEKLAGVIFVYMDPSTLSDTQGKRIHVEHEYGSALFCLYKNPPDIDK